MKNLNKKTIPNLMSGFSLIEIMVSMSIFIIVMVIASGALISIVNANRKARAIQSVMNNINFVMENMSRNMRLGYNYHCGPTGSIESPQDCIAGDNFVAFESVRGSEGNPGDQVIYRLLNNRIEKSETGGPPFLRITADDIFIDNLTFYVEGSLISDNLQPKVVITVKGYAGSTEKTKTNFSLQTTVSQRLLDI